MPVQEEMRESARARMGVMWQQEGGPYENAATPCPGCRLRQICAAAGVLLRRQLRSGVFSYSTDFQFEGLTRTRAPRQPTSNLGRR